MCIWSDTETGYLIPEAIRQSFEQEAFSQEGNICQSGERDTTIANTFKL